MAHSAKEAGRAAILIKKRQKEQDELAAKKRKIEEELRIGSIANKFAAHYDAIEQKLKSDTVGLVSLDEMKAKQEDVVKARQQQIASNTGESRLEADNTEVATITQAKHKQVPALSFCIDEFDDEDDSEDSDVKTDSSKEITVKKEEKDNCETKEQDTTEKTVARRRFGKNPEVDTTFLPDRDRDEEDARLREELRREWQMKQDRVKSEEVEITYSYWDGSGHRRTIRMRKGNSIAQLLQRCLERLRREFNELKTASVEHLMYVKEDLIIPHHYTFYDFIVTKARGKSGPLFSFDVHDDVRVRADASVEKDESHAGKVCLRAWYERNKHIFPASRWEPYDPDKCWDRYTIRDKEAAKITVK